MFLQDIGASFTKHRERTDVPHPPPAIDRDVQSWIKIVWIITGVGVKCGYRPQGLYQQCCRQIINWEDHLTEQSQSQTRDANIFF